MTSQLLARVGRLILTRCVRICTQIKSRVFVIRRYCATSGFLSAAWLSYLEILLNWWAVLSPLLWTLTRISPDFIHGSLPLHFSMSFKTANSPHLPSNGHPTPPDCMSVTNLTVTGLTNVRYLSIWTPFNTFIGCEIIFLIIIGNENCVSTMELSSSSIICSLFYRKFNVCSEFSFLLFKFVWLFSSTLISISLICPRECPWQLGPDCNITPCEIVLFPCWSTNVATQLMLPKNWHNHGVVGFIKTIHLLVCERDIFAVNIRHITAYRSCTIQQADSPSRAEISDLVMSESSGISQYPMILIDIFFMIMCFMSGATTVTVPSEVPGIWQVSYVSSRCVTQIRPIYLWWSL